MNTTFSTSDIKKTKPRGIICGEDKQEIEFSILFKLWLDGKIDYNTLKRNFPDQYESFFNKLIRFLLYKIN